MRLERAKQKKKFFDQIFYVEFQRQLRRKLVKLGRQREGKGEEGVERGLLMLFSRKGDPNEILSDRLVTLGEKHGELGSLCNLEEGEGGERGHF